LINITSLIKGVKNEQGQEDATTDILSSFYVSDIDRIRATASPDDRVAAYILAVKAPASARVEIDRDTKLHEGMTTSQPLSAWQMAVGLQPQLNATTGD
jgi:hypothetical protein